jgi:hypothetical protein
MMSQGTPGIGKLKNATMDYSTNNKYRQGASPGRRGQALCFFLEKPVYDGSIVYYLGYHYVTYAASDITSDRRSPKIPKKE